MSAGLAGQLGFKSESSWGTPVVVDKFHAGFLDGNPVRDSPPLVSKGARAGRRTAACVQPGTKTVEGNFKLELYTAPMATLLRHMFGTILTTGSGPYTHTASPGPLNGKSFTSQVGIPDLGGNVRPFTYAGCKIPEWTVRGEVGKFGELDLKVSAKDYVTATALASASYLDDCPFSFVEGAVTVAGSPVASIENFEITSKRPLRIKHGFGSRLIVEQKEEGQAEYGFNFNADFEDLTLHDLADTEAALVVTFDDGDNSLEFTMNGYVLANTPEFEGVDKIAGYEFKTMLMGDSDADAISAVLVNTESSSA